MQEIDVTVFAASRSMMRPRFLVDLSGTQVGYIAKGAAALRDVVDPQELMIRLYCPAPVVAFTTRELRRPGYQDATRAARSHGFTPVVRGPGGHAAAYHQQSLCIEVFGTAQDPRRRIHERYEVFNEALRNVLEDLGVSTHQGQLPAEYCPGESSLMSHGVKVVGSAQRLSGSRWMWGAGLIISKAVSIKSALTEIYALLGLELNPSTIGSLEDLNVRTTPEECASRIRERFDTADLYSAVGSLA